jgi:glutathione S-transferase
VTVTLFHHPFSRAATVVWMLEEVGVPYELRFVDFKSNAQKSAEFLALNPMGKLPTLVDGDAVVTEVAAIGLYLADRYSYGTLAPKVDDAARGTYMRWSFFAPSVIEPGSLAHASKWEFRASAAGWGSHAEMLTSIEYALSKGPYLLGERFSMADVIFGGTLRYMLTFKMLEPRTSFSNYVARLDERPAYQRAVAKNQEVIKAHGLG